MTPAVLTESVYCLVREGQTPEEVVAITTTDGRERIQQELFDSEIWLNFLADLEKTFSFHPPAFGLADYHIRVMPSPDHSENMSDVRRNDEIAACADFILSIIRQFTENPDCKLSLCITGGRKSMSAIAALSLSLLGRECDRLCHVLVSPPFDNPALKPKYYYPPARKTAFTFEGTEYTANAEDLCLGYIPYVRLRDIFQSSWNRIAGGYMDTVKTASGALESNIVAPTLKIKPDKSSLEIGKHRIDMSVPEYILYWMLAHRRKKGLPPVYGQDNLLEEFKAFSGYISRADMPEIINYGEKLLYSKNEEDMRKHVHGLASKIRKALQGESKKVKLCLPTEKRGVYGLALPPERICCPSPTSYDVKKMDAGKN